MNYFLDTNLVFNIIYAERPRNNKARTFYKNSKIMNNYEDISHKRIQRFSN
jgi:hypothetical protein